LIIKYQEEFGGDANAIGSTVALLVGILLIVIVLLKGGFIDNILSGFLLLGFVTSVAILVSTEQIASLFGIRIGILAGLMIPTYI
jgi:MFS superfamily sulfate permease-like transporter